jgi:hypothetical protein
MLPIRGSKVVIDRNFDEVRPKSRAPRLQHNRHSRDTHLQLVRRQISKQPLHQAPVIRLANDVVVNRSTLGLLWHGLPGGCRGRFLLVGHLPILEAISLSGLLPPLTPPPHETITLWLWIL